MDAIAQRPGQLGQFQHAGGQDDRGGQQEGEPGRVLPGQAPAHARDHGDAIPADPGEQREDLRRADGDRLQVAHPDQSLVRRDALGQLFLAQRLVAGDLPVPGPGDLARRPGRALARPVGRLARLVQGLIRVLLRPVPRRASLVPGSGPLVPGSGRLVPGRACCWHEFPVPLGGHRLVGLDRGARPELLPAVQDDPVDDQEHPGQDGLAEQLPERLVRDHADQTDRDGGQDDHPGQLLVPGAHLAVPDRAEEPADDPDPVPPEVDEQGQRGGHVHADDEGQVRRGRLGHVQIAGPAAADQGGEQHVVSQAGHREQLRYPLDQADHGSLEVGDVRHEGLSGLPSEPPGS